ncbi:putative quinol monooxygenase [Nocardia sp. CNY236]|uniref:putative quinol monooxygenase n=1 Tax=Nocardia sp. CNY236 TaxID=1169152 RepID=UPI0003FB2562|nr:putative quinol monooxygenase [Nocardia sp. CNY236]
MSTLVLNVRFIAKPGKEKEVREVLEAALEPTRAEEGCISYELYQHYADPTRMALLEEWVDADALATHFETPHLKAVIAGLENILVEPFDLRKYNEIK